MNGRFRGLSVSALGIFVVAALAACSGADQASVEDVPLGPVQDQGVMESALEADVQQAPDSEGAASTPSRDGFAAPAPLAACAAVVDPARELVIRHLGAVNDAARTTWTGGTATTKDGAWSFGRLMTNMAGANDPQLFVRGWLSRWETNRVVNTFTTPARTQIRSSVINTWPKDAAGKLDLRKAPLRLLAIANRMDLRQLSAGNAGEGRFLFGVTDAAGNPLSFTVILEYKLPATTAAEAQTWAQQWHALGALPIGTAAEQAKFNAALQEITDRFAGKNAAPTKINGSSIGQVRTNEITLAAPWELREFRLSSTGQLVQSTTAQTPDSSLLNDARTGRFINTNQTAILGGRHVVPLAFEALAFRGGSAPTDFTTIWNPANATDKTARHLFSVNTCNGCHGGETSTTFLHVAPRAKTSVAALSTFMTGKTVRDPVSGVTRTFSDLSRRKIDLQNFLCPPPAGSAEGEEPSINRVH